MCVQRTPVEETLSACLKTSVQSVPALLVLGRTPCPRWLVLQWMRVTRHLATPLPAAPPLPPDIPALVLEDMLETPTRQDASLKVAAPTETRTARRRVFASTGSARTSAMTPVDPIQSAQSTTVLRNVSACKDSFQAPWTQERVSETARAAELMQTVVEAQLAREVNAGYLAAARTTVLLESSAVRACA